MIGIDGIPLCKNCVGSEIGIFSAYCRCALFQRTWWVLGNKFSKNDGKIIESVDFLNVENYNNY